jgi:dipeptidyl aminopeptidase/acylaminoacyl peptidase
VRSETITFFSAGTLVTGTLRVPDRATIASPGIVQGPGWLGLRDAALYEPYHEALTDAGFAVLIFDYRGFGDSAGDRGMLSPGAQLQDLVNAVTWLASRPDIDASRIGVFGSGGTGGGNAVLLAARDDRVRCAVSQVPVADGADWLRRMRGTEDEWQAFLDRLADDRAQRVTTGEGARVHPREEIMIPSAERRATTVKKDVDGRIPTSVPLAAADEILAYRPVDAAPRVPGLCIVAVDGDLVTPTDHAEALFDAAPAPKQLIMQYDTTHYAAYRQHGPEVIPRIVDWFTQHIGGPVGEEETIVEVRE